MEPITGETFFGRPVKEVPDSKSSQVFDQGPPECICLVRAFSLFYLPFLEERKSSLTRSLLYRVRQPNVLVLERPFHALPHFP